MEFSKEIATLAEQALQAGRQGHHKFVTAESCTGGLIAAALTDIPGSSDVFDRGFVTYSNLAKFEMLAVPLENTEGQPGAVSRLVAGLMAQGALDQNFADISVAVTGIAGPGGGSAQKPVGLVYVAVKRQDHRLEVEECHFGDIGRTAIRQRTVITALTMLITACED